MAKNRGLSFYRRKKKISSALVREIFGWIFGFAVTIFIGTVFVIFFGLSTNVVGSSMENTLSNGQKIYIDRFTYIISSPKIGNVVVFLPNGNENSHYYVKRVVAKPGDTVMIKSGILYVNGIESKLCKEYINEPGIAENQFTLEAGQYFCIGDSPNNSEDSRSANIGPIDETNIIGRAWFHMRSNSEGIGFID